MFWYIGPKCPFKKQYELAAWAKEKWPDDPPSKYDKMKLSRLRAIWYSVARRAEQKGKTNDKNNKN